MIYSEKQPRYNSSGGEDFLLIFFLFLFSSQESDIPQNVSEEKNDSINYQNDTIQIYTVEMREKNHS